MATASAPASRARVRWNVVILAVSWALFLVAMITAMTPGGLVGERLTPTPALATAPIASMLLGTIASTLFASLPMRRVGRRPGLLLGALAGALGGRASLTGLVDRNAARDAPSRGRARP